MKRVIMIGLTMVGVVAAIVGVLFLTGAFDGKTESDVSMDGSKPVAANSSRKKGRIAAARVPAVRIGREVQHVKIDGTLPARPVDPHDIAAFNEAVDAGFSVENAAKKSFPAGTDTDGLLAALKLMSGSKDAKVRCGVYKAVARLFTDADDLGAAVATAKALLQASPTMADDGAQEIDLGEGESAAEDDGAKVSSEKSSEKSADADVVDDSEAEPQEEASGEVQIPVADGSDPLCDGVQGEMIEKLLKEGVSDADGEVRKEALSAASQMEDHFRYGAYEEALKGNDSALKKEVLELCSTFGREEDVAVQKQALNDADPDVAAAAQKNLDSEAAKAFLEADAAAKAAEPAASVE